MNILRFLRTPSIFTPDDLHVYRKAQLVNYLLIFGAVILLRAALNNYSYQDETTTLYVLVSVYFQFFWVAVIVFAFCYFRVKRKITFPSWVAALSIVWVVANMVHFKLSLATPLVLLVPMIVFPTIGLRWGALIYILFASLTLYWAISDHLVDPEVTPSYLVNNLAYSLILGGVVCWFLELGRYEVIDRLYKSATRDALTQCWNRAMFQKGLDAEISRAKRFNSVFSLALFDIDHFKLINDRHGHHIGDLVLKKFASIINEQVREIDIFARWGGEEFVLLLTGLDSETADKKVEELLQAVRAHQFEDVGSVTVSAGLATFQDGSSASELMKMADVALYRAKEAGRDQLVAG